MDLGYGKGLLWLLSEMTGPPLPPYLLEVVMVNGHRYCVHSGNSRDEKRNSLVLNVYDFRAIDQSSETIIKEKLDEDTWGEVSKPEDLHPLLKTGRLRCDLDEISYCVEWLSRWWTLSSQFPELPDKQKRALGFDLPVKDE